MISAGHLDVIPWDDAAAAADADGATTLMGVAQIIGGEERLPYDHDEIVVRAVDKIRADHAAQPDPYGLLREPFTLRQLEHLHRNVDPVRTPPKDTFRRSMEDFLMPTGDLTEGTRGKPARLFTKA